jgi:uncharacterized protein
MSREENVRIVKKFFEAMGRGSEQVLLALSAEDIEWIIPGEGWPLAGTHREPQALTHRDRYHTKRSVKSTNMLNSGNAF